MDQIQNQAIAKKEENNPIVEIIQRYAGEQKYQRETDLLTDWAKPLRYAAPGYVALWKWTTGENRPAKKTLLAALDVYNSIPQDWRYKLAYDLYIVIGGTIPITQDNG